VLIELIDLLEHHFSQFYHQLLGSLNERCVGLDSTNDQTAVYFKQVCVALGSTLSSNIKLAAQAIRSVASSYLADGGNQLDQFNTFLGQSVQRILLSVLAELEAVEEERSRFYDTKSQRRLLIASFQARMFSKTILAELSSLFDFAELRTSFSQISRELASWYVAASGRYQASLFRYHDQLSHSAEEVVGPSPFLAKFSQFCKSEYGILKEWFPADAPPQERQHTRVGSNAASGSSRTSNDGQATFGKTKKPSCIPVLQRRDQLLSEADRVFSMMSAVLNAQPSAMDGASIFEAVAVYTFKAIGEQVRETPTFTKQCIHQLQVDAYRLLLLVTSAPWVRKEENTLVCLINECCTSAYDRCGDKSPLSAALVEKLAKD
jgi:hypothetical protein